MRRFVLLLGVVSALGFIAVTLAPGAQRVPVVSYGTAIYHADGTLTSTNLSGVTIGPTTPDTVAAFCVYGAQPVTVAASNASAIRYPGDGGQSLEAIFGPAGYCPGAAAYVGAQGIEQPVEFQLYSG